MTAHLNATLGTVSGANATAGLTNTSKRTQAAKAIADSVKAAAKEAEAAAASEHAAADAAENEATKGKTPGKAAEKAAAEAREAVEHPPEPPAEPEPPKPLAPGMANASKDTNASSQARLHPGEQAVATAPKEGARTSTGKLLPKEKDHPLADKEKTKSWLDGVITWQFCIGILVFMIIMYGIFEYIHRRECHAEWSVGRPTDREEQVPPQFTMANFTLTYEYFSGDGAVRGTMLLGASVALSMVGVWLSYSVNMLVARYWDALQNKDYPRFIEALLAFIAITLGSQVGNTYGAYVRRIFFLHWRESLTRRSWKLWLNDSAHYYAQTSRQKLENPDQRIQVDCDRYVGITMGLMTDVVGTVGSLVVFLPMLYHLSPPIFPVPGWLCYFVITYCMLGTWVMQYIGEKVAVLAYAMERAEADFRASLITVRDYGEGVAMYGAEEAEMRILDHFFQHLRGIYWQTSFLSRKLGMFTGVYGSLADLLPIFVLTPAYFSGYLTMGSLLQVRHAVGEVGGGFSWFVTQYFTLAEWTAVSTRLNEIDKMAAAHKAQLATQPERLTDLELRNVTLEADRKTLVQGASFRLKPGDWALMTGPEGAGKSTVMRAMRGIWPIEGGALGPPQGLPPTQVMFVPAARASGLRRMSLTAAVAYPQHVGKMRVTPVPTERRLSAATGETDDIPAGVEGAANQEERERAEIVKALDTVGLSYLWPKGEPEPHMDWGRTLSSGELARLLLARVVVLKPEHLCMDEPVANCAEKEPTAKLFTALKESMVPHASVLTVSHDVTDLTPFHNVQITLDPKMTSLNVKGL